jgi:hydroxymethylbilane synthase
VPLGTRGDRLDVPLAGLGGKGLFTLELEAALRDGKVHLAVHSAKDLPAELAADVVIAAVPERADARDALVTRDGAGPDDLPPGARVGTASLRRRGQLLARRPDLRIGPLRGNVPTRLARLRGGEFGAIVLARAGLTRLGLAELPGCVATPLAVEDFVPAAGQGALAVECLAADAATRDLLGRVNSADAAAAVEAEREAVRTLGADCHSAVGIHVRRAGDVWRAVGWVGGDEPGRSIRHAAEGRAADTVAVALVEALLADGAADLLAG